MGAIVINYFRRIIAYVLTITLLLIHIPVIQAQAAAEITINSKRIDQIVNGAMGNYRIPGLSLGIVKGDQVVYLKGYGLADDSGRLVTPQMPFILGSISKSFTALAVMQLVEQGKINLDSPVQYYLPWFKLYDPKVSRYITVRHLLNQTSGISTFVGRTISNGGHDSIEDAVRNMDNVKLSKPVGETFQYSNSNYLILGELIQYVSGLAYKDYIALHIFKPLQMNNSFAEKSKAEKAGLVSGYQPIFGNMTATNPDYLPENVPSGYLISSAEDMTHYIIAQLSSGKFQDESILSAEGISTMHKSSSSYPYGMGWFVGPNLISHSGDTENFHAEMTIFTTDGWGFVILMNTNDTLSTMLYGNIYSNLSNSIIHMIQNGDSLLIGDYIASHKLGGMETFINIVLIVIVGWLLRSFYRLAFRKIRFNGLTTGFVAVQILIILIHFILPLIFLLAFPKFFVAPWRMILLFVPGVGHALLFIPIALIVLGLIKMVLLVHQMRKAKYHN